MNVNKTTSNNSNDILLRHIENSGGNGSTSVDTSDLLDMLEQEVINNKASGGAASNDFSSSLHSLGSLPEDEPRTSASESDRGRNTNNNRRKQSRGTRNGYSSGDSLNSSFTSNLLGGNIDADDLLPQADNSIAATETNNTVACATVTSSNASSTAKSHNSSDKSSQQSAATPRRNQRTASNSNGLDGSFTSRNTNYTSDNSSKHAPLRSRPSFDNPFRSSSTNLNRMAATKATSNNISARRGSLTEYGGDASGSDSKGTLSSGGGNHLQQVLRDDELGYDDRRGSGESNNNSDNNNNNKLKGHVSFSIQEDQDTYAATLNHHEDVTKSLSSADTFSLGSLAGTLLSVSTRSSHTSRSSRSSRSSHGSGTTASTHSSNSTQDRRRRRELLPVKQDHRRKKSGTTSGSSAGNSSSAGTSSFSANSGSVSQNKFQHHSSRRSRKKSQSGDASSGSGSASSRNLYNNRSRKGANSVGGSSGTGTGSSGGSNSNEEGAYGNLHDHHPIRYPKRSGLYGQIEEGNENDGDDEDSPPQTEDMAPISHITNSHDSGNNSGMDSRNDEDGLFRRVNKVRTEIMEGNDNGLGHTDDFLDGLIASTTTDRHGYKQTSNRRQSDDNDAISVGETSFLSDLLVSNSNARKRKGGSVISGGSASTLTNTTASTISTLNNAYKKRHSEYGDHSTVISTFHRYYDEGGALLPKSRKEWAVLLVLALLLSPLVHLVVVYAMSFIGISRTYVGGEMQYINSGQVVGSATTAKRPADDYRQKMRESAAAMAHQSELLSNAWAGSSQVMLSKSSSLGENFILIPDADWIELQISRSRGSSYFSRKGNDAPKAPQRLPLPSLINPLYDSTDTMVLYTLTAVGPTNTINKKLTPNLSRMNANANAELWDAIQTSLIPRPTDVWPCWAHNSLAQFREDGYTVMYPYEKRKEARWQLAELAKVFGQSVIYEFVTFSETSPKAEDGSGTIGFASASSSTSRGGSIRGGEGLGATEERLVGKDGRTIIIPALPNKRSDIMIRRTINTSTSSMTALNVMQDAELPTVVMRRVKDLPVEDELTMREWEGPPLEKIVWKTTNLLEENVWTKQRTSR